VEARYFRCSVLGLEVTVAIADSAEFKDYDFCILSPASCRGCEAFLDGLADCVARKLAVHGYEVVRPFDFGRVGKGGMLYQLDPGAHEKPSGQVITKEF
jgi:hypothetical protein